MANDVCRRLAVLLPLLVLGGAARCDFNVETCPDLDEICPDLECADYVQNRDGCSICECVGEDEPVICFDDSECADGQLCDTVNFCEPAPGCSEDGPCPSVCYGHCIAAPTPCAADGDCPDGQICSFFGNTRGDAGAREQDLAPVPAPDGVCVPADCDATIDLPACPPGTELVVDFANDPCGVPGCFPIDRCRELPPDLCVSAPGCALVDEPCACAPDGTCDDCASVSRCVSVDECGSLTPDQCLVNPRCELLAVDGGGGGSSDAPICEVCDPNTGTCEPCDGGGAPPPEPPPADLVCVPRNEDGTCLVDAECAAGEICSPTTVCATGCVVNDDGSEECFSECWNERGVCVPSDASCFNLAADQCASDPRCELVPVPCACDPNSADCVCVDEEQCRPVSAQCNDDGECLADQHCETVETCPPCDPSTGSDIGCAAPCFVEGRCVDGPPPPTQCLDDVDCGAGFACVTVDVCDACTGLRPGGGAAGDPAPPCETTCTTERVCIAIDPVCYSDGDCGPGEFCDLSAYPDCDATNNGLVACPGQCRALERTLCQSDDQCSPEQRCPTELDICQQNPDAPDSGCWWTCVDRPREEGTYCIDDVECLDGETCRFHPDVCLSDPARPSVCSGWCAGVCGEAETKGLDPETQQCVQFNDTCIPPGWIPNGC